MPKNKMKRFYQMALHKLNIIHLKKLAQDKKYFNSLLCLMTNVDHKSLSKWG